MKTFLKILKLVGALGLICYDVALISAASKYGNGGWLDMAVLTATGIYALLAVFAFCGGTLKKVLGTALMVVSGVNILLRLVSLVASIILNGKVIGNTDFAWQLLLYYCASTVLAAAVFLCGLSAYKPKLYKPAGIIFAVSFVAFIVFYIAIFMAANLSATDFTNYLMLLGGEGFELLPPAAILCVAAVFIDLCFAKEVLND